MVKKMNMKNKTVIYLAVLIILIGAVVGYRISSKSSSSVIDNDDAILENGTFLFQDVSLNWIVVGGFKLKHDETVVYIDPKDVNRKTYDLLEPADYLIITHDHTPHYSPLDMYYLSDDETIWITAPGIRVSRENQITVHPGETLTFDDVIFEFTPSYNIDKRRPSGELFHPPEHQNLGVVVDFDGTRVYHAGDSDVIPEMGEIVTDVALLPVSGFAWMTALEAVEAVELLKASGELDFVIPIHYGYNQGTDTNALVFSNNANCSVVVLPRLFDRD